MNETDFLKKRLLDLANTAYNKGICTFTDFLNLNEISVLTSMGKDLNFVPFAMYGGYENAERRIVRFGEMDTEYPITCLHITPLIKKFSDELGHRDYLGALINLGITRDVLGDIIVQDKEAYLFCLNSISEFIMENLTRIKHTSVMARPAESLPDAATDNSVEKDILVSSLRLDAVIAQLYNLSRSKAGELFTSGLVFLNDQSTTNNSYQLKENDKVNVRGKGKFVYLGTNFINKKGKSNIKLKVF